jgi:transposase
MGHFVEGDDRYQAALLPSCLDDYVDQENPARVIDVFVDELSLGELGFEVVPAATGRPAYHPATMLKLYIYGYLNRVQSSRRLEREAQRNVELMWLTGKLAPDHKTIANFRKADQIEEEERVARDAASACKLPSVVAEGREFAKGVAGSFEIVCVLPVEGHDEARDPDVGGVRAEASRTCLGVIHALQPDRVGDALRFQLLKLEPPALRIAGHPEVAAAIRRSAPSAL